MTIYDEHDSDFDIKSEEDDFNKTGSNDENQEAEAKKLAPKNSKK